MNGILRYSGRVARTLCTSRRDRGEVEHVAHGRIEGAYAALAQDHLCIPFCEYVLGAQQQIRDCRGHAALEQHGAAELADGLEEGIVLHVARADLYAVCVLRDDARTFIIHCFRDDGQAGFLARAHQQAQAFDAESLE